MKKITRWIGLFYQFFFRPNDFIEVSVSDSIAKAFQTNKQLAEKYPDKKLPEEKINEYRNFHKKATSVVRTSISRNLFYCSFPLIPALITYKILPVYIKIYGILSAFIILWAVLSEVGWEIQTFKGNSLPEQVNKVWFRLIQSLGMYFLFLSILQI